MVLREELHPFVVSPRQCIRLCGFRINAFCHCFGVDGIRVYLDYPVLERSVNIKHEIIADSLIDIIDAVFVAVTCLHSLDRFEDIGQVV